MSKLSVRRIVIRTAAVLALAGAVVIGPASLGHAGGNDGRWHPGAGAVAVAE